MKTIDLTCNQVLTLKGLRFEANLGILEHELKKPQPILVDVELNMGSQPLLPDQDNINNVLDYRRVHEMVIKTCTENHVNLLESLTGKLCTRLMAFTNVTGVKVKITKLEIFSDCEVAIRMQTGQWSQED